MKCAAIVTGGGWSMAGRWLVDGWSMAGRWLVDGWSAAARLVDGWSMAGRRSKKLLVNGEVLNVLLEKVREGCIVRKRVRNVI